MCKQLGVQIVKGAFDFEVVFVTKERSLNLLQKSAPEGYTNAIWQHIRTRGLDQIKNWFVSEEEEGFGVIVYQGEYYEFDRRKRVFSKDWPEEPQKALIWFQRNVQPQLVS
jgi:hypothetical protein